MSKTRAAIRVWASEDMARTVASRRFGIASWPVSADPAGRSSAGKAGHDAKRQAVRVLTLDALVLRARDRYGSIVPFGPVDRGLHVGVPQRATVPGAGPVVRGHVGLAVGLETRHDPIMRRAVRIERRDHERRAARGLDEPDHGLERRRRCRRTAARRSRRIFMGSPQLRSLWRRRPANRQDERLFDRSKGVRDAGTEENEVAFFLQRNFPIWKHQNEVTPDEDVERPHGARRGPLFAPISLGMGVPLELDVAGAQGLLSPGMKWPRNQPRVFFEASTTFPKKGVGESAVMGLQFQGTAAVDQIGDGPQADARARRNDGRVQHLRLRLNNQRATSVATPTRWLPVVSTRRRRRPGSRPRTSLMMRFEMRASRSYGRRAQSAVMPSTRLARRGSRSRSRTCARRP